MDPVTAIQLASAVLSFVQAGATVLKTAKEIRDSKDGLSDDTRSRQVITESMEGVIRKLRAADHDGIACDPSLSEVVAECEDLSGKIEDYLQRIQTSRLGRFGSASKALFKKDELEGLERKLDRCRSQLELALGNLRDERLVGYFRELESLIQNDRSKFDQLDADVKQLVDGVRLGHIGGEAKVQLEGILGIHDDALCAVYQERILRSLRFEGMGRRYESVVDHHQKTFRWIFEEKDEAGANENNQSSNDTDEGYQSSNGTKEDVGSSSDTDEDVKFSSDTDENDQPPEDTTSVEILKMKHEAREKFSTWLSSPTGIFHVSGKLGSGKSTLMKFLYTSERTRAGVKKWAGTRKLVFANFFFWKPGSEMQKSLGGLFRSLLHDILKACPELTQEVLYEYWAEAKQTPLQIQTEFKIPLQAVKKAVEKLIVGDRVSKDRCFCFFLDGLDEYDDSPRHQHDQTFLVDLLHRWSKTSGGNLMLCVSSREDNVFMNAFQETQRLRLHTLTWFDIWNYTRHALERFPNRTVRDRLIETIPHKAEGIFLWAVLVVKNIREIIPDGGIREHELGEILDDLPSGVEELLQRIVRGLSKRDRKKAYQTLSLLQAARGSGLPLSLLAFSFLDKYHRDPDFALRDEFSTHVTDSDRKDDNAPILYQKQLRRVCGGLVEHQQPSKFSEWDKPWGHVDYTHRSVPELFEEGELKKDLESTLGDFNNVVALAHLVIAQVRFLDDEVSKAIHLYAGLANMLLKKESEKEPYPILELIDSQVKNSGCQNPGPNDRVLLQDSRTGSRCLGSKARPPEVGYLTYFSTLCFAISRGFDEYAKWKIKHDTRALDSPFKRAVAAALILGQGYAEPCSWIQDHFDRRLFADETRACFNTFFRWDVVDRATPANMTIWERYQTMEFLNWCTCTLPARIYSFHRAGQIIERFLRFGAATDLMVVVRGEVEVEEITFDFENARVAMKPFDSGTQCGKVPPEVFSMLRRLRGCEGDVHFSLRDWIEAADPENKDCLLGLLDDREEAEREKVERRLGHETHAEPPCEELEGEPKSGEQGSPNEKEGTLKTEIVPVPITEPLGDAEFRQKVILGLVAISILCSAWVRYGARKG